MQHGLENSGGDLTPSPLTRITDAIFVCVTEQFLEAR